MNETAHAGQGAADSRAADTGRRYNTLSAWLRSTFGCRVYKVTIDAGFTCPNREAAAGGDGGAGGCSFCLPDALRPTAYDTAGSTVTGQLDLGMERLRQRYAAESFIAYFQINTNTYAPVDELRRLYTEAASHPGVVGLAVSTRPDCAGDDVLDLLAEVAIGKKLWLELGLQSSNDRTLERIGRGHTAADFADAVARARGRGIDVCAHLVAGLPGEGRDDLMRTVGFVSEARVWGVKFHQLQVLKGTALEAEYRGGRLGVLGLEEYSRLVVESIEALPPEVVIHRLCGDAPRGLVVAPRWGGSKFDVIARVDELLARRDSCQGARHAAGPGGTGTDTTR